MEVGLQGEFSSTGNFSGRPITMNVLPRINLQGRFNSLIFSNIIRVLFRFQSISRKGFSKELACDAFPAK